MSKASASDKAETDYSRSFQNAMYTLAWKFEPSRQRESQRARQSPTNSTNEATKTQPTQVPKHRNSSCDKFNILETEKNEQPPQRPNSVARTSIPNKVLMTPTLFSLAYVDKGLTALPAKVLENKHQINLLDLSMNKFDFFPLDLLFLKNLKILRLDNNRIKGLPTDLSHLQQLEMLSLSYNLLQFLPPNLQKLPNLCDLNIEFNLLNALGPEITDLKSLKVLNINKNRLTLFPTAFCDMLALEDLCFEWFKYANPPLQSKQRGKEGEDRIQRLRDACKELRQKNSKGLTFLSFLEVISTAKVNLQALDDTKKSFLHYAALYEDISVIKYLISTMPALIDLADSEGQTPLTTSLIKEKYLSARYLLKQGADATKGGGMYGSPLHIAVRKLNLQLVKDLIKAGEKLNKIDNEGHTPLHHAISLMADTYGKAAAIAQFLLDSNTNPNSTNKENWGPLHLACKRKDVKTLEWIIAYNEEVEEIHGSEAKFKINLKGGAYQWTGMHIAAYLDAPAVIETLVRAKGKIFKKSLNGYTPKRLVHDKGLALKILEKYEKSYLHTQILNRKAPRVDNPVIVNLQNLNKVKEIFNASKNKFERGILFEYSHDTSPRVVNSNDNTRLIYSNYKYNKQFEPVQRGLKVKSKVFNDSFEVAPETETQISIADDNNTARLNFCNDLNEHTHIKANNLTPGIDLTDKSVKSKEDYHVLNPTKNKFSWGNVQLLHVDVANYELYLKNQPNFGLEFCRKELKVIKEHYHQDRIIYTEKTKIFLLLRMLHQKILAFISKTLRMKLSVYQYPLLSMRDPAAAATRNSLGLNLKKAEVQTAALLFDLVPQTVLSFYPGVTRNYEDNMLKAMILSMIEELYYYEAFEFLDAVKANPSESIMTKQNAARIVANLRSFYSTLNVQARTEENHHQTTAKQRTRTLSPTSSGHTRIATIDKGFSMKKRVPSGIGMQSPLGMQLSPKITFTPIKILSKQPS